MNGLDIWAKPISQLLDRGGGGGGGGVLVLFEFEHLTERGCFLVYIVFIIQILNGQPQCTVGQSQGLNLSIKTIYLYLRMAKIFALLINKPGKERFEYFTLICTLF